MPTYTYFILFIFGITIGSFLNVCIYRIPRKEDIVITPSHCMGCGKRIQWFDLVPILSFLVLKGRCRHCRTRLSYQYPMIEFVNGLAYVLLAILLGVTPYMIMMCIVFSTLLVIAMIDLRHMIIPNSILLFFFVIALGYRLFISKEYLDAFLGFFAASGFLYLVHLLSGGNMGLGDVKLMAVFGLFLGWKNILLAMFLGSIVGSIIGLSLMAFKVITRKQMIPFGPFLSSGILLAGVFGENLIQWYLSLLS